MRKQREVKEFKNVKEIIYNSAKEYSDNVAFIKKEQINKKAEYTNITYKDLLNQINYLLKIHTGLFVAKGRHLLYIFGFPQMTQFELMTLIYLRHLNISLDFLLSFKKQFSPHTRYAVGYV